MKKWLSTIAASFLLVTAGFNLHSYIREAKAGVTCSVPFNLTNGTTADASQVMANYNALIACLANAAAAGVNNDITSLLGLTTPLPPSEGGSTVFIGQTPTASGNTIVVASTTPSGFSYTKGYTVVFIAQATNVATQTINVNNQGDVNLFKQSPSGPTALTGGEIATNQIVSATYDGTEFQTNPVPNVTPSFGLSTNASQTAIQINTNQPPYGFDSPVNLGLQAYADAGNLLHVNIVQANGQAPSATSTGPVLIPFSNPNNGQVSWVAVTASTSINTNATGASLGSLNNTPFRFWIVAFNNSGTVVPALFNASVPTPTVQVYPLDTSTPQSSTAVSAAATSPGVFYTPNGTTVSSQPFTILGYLEYANGLGTAGTYASNPTKIQLFGPSIKKPGDTVQGPFFNQDATLVGPGGSYQASRVQQGITPTSKVNLIEVHGVWAGQCGGSDSMFVAPGRIGAGAFGGINIVGAAGTVDFTGMVEGIDAPASVASNTYAIFLKSGGGCSINSLAGSNSTISVREIQG